MKSYLPLGLGLAGGRPKGIILKEFLCSTNFSQKQSYCLFTILLSSRPKIFAKSAKDKRQNQNKEKFGRKMLITFAVFAVVFVVFLVGLLFYLTPVSLTH